MNRTAFKIDVLRTLRLAGLEASTTTISSILQDDTALFYRPYWGELCDQDRCAMVYEIQVMMNVAKKHNRGV